MQIDAEILIRQIQQDIRMKDLESPREHSDQFCGEIWTSDGFLPDLH